MVLQEAGHDIDVCIWGGVHGHKDFHRDPPRDNVLAEEDGSTNLWTIIHSRVQHFGYS